SLREGQIRVVVSSTSLELGIDIGAADLTVQVGSPGSVMQCLQRVGRAGHSSRALSRGLLLAATQVELATNAIIAQAALTSEVESINIVRAPLDIVCQQLIGMACAGDQSAS